VNFEPVFARCELDTHADTCALGRNFTPLSFTGRVCDVSPYSSEHYESEKNVPIITGATAYTCQESGQTYILVVNEGLWLGPKMKHSLLNPNQMRYNRVTVHDNPFNPHDPCLFNMTMQPSHFPFPAPIFFSILEHQPNMNSTIVHTCISPLKLNGIHKLCVLCLPNLWRRK
jgi:hypothetical protein